jgi:hypothetical protein
MTSKHCIFVSSLLILFIALSPHSPGQVREEFVPLVHIAPANTVRDAFQNTAIMPSDASRKPKSRMLAIAYSLLLPGMGELYAERFDRGIYPLVLEGALWLGFVGFNAYGGWLQTDSRSFAVQHAGARVDGKDDQFFVDMANYASTHDYNLQKLVDRNLAALYSEEPGSAYLWQWSSNADRMQYKDQRTRSEEMYNASKFVVLGMIANRIWSAIQASVFTRDYNNNLTSTSYLRRIDMHTRLTAFQGRTDGVSFMFSAQF